MILRITQNNQNLVLNRDREWHKRLLELAQVVSRWSKDPSTKVGAVITDNDKRIISLGYNGFPKGVEDTQERLSNREQKYKYTVHAEMNAMLFAQRELTDAYLYTYPFAPCADCAGPIIQSGINPVVSLIPSPEFEERWGKSFEIAEMMFNESGKSLILFERSLLWPEL